jgi:hypothetical protein
MARKRNSPTEPKVVQAAIRRRGRSDPARVGCGHCRQPLPGLFFLSSGEVYLDALDTEGWVVDGGTLRLGTDSSARRQSTRGTARASPRGHERAAAGRALAGKKYGAFLRSQPDRPLLPRDPMLPAPERLECPRCHALNLVAAQSDVVDSQNK